MFSVNPSRSSSHKTSTHTPPASPLTSFVESPGNIARLKAAYEADKCGSVMSFGQWLASPDVGRTVDELRLGLEIAEGSDLNLDGEGCKHPGSALYLVAASPQNIEKARLLLNYNPAPCRGRAVNINLPGGPESRTPLHVAVQADNSELVALLCARDDLEPAAQDADGRTALQIAIATGKPAIAGMLRTQAMKSVRGAYQARKEDYANQSLPAWCLQDPECSAAQLELALASQEQSVESSDDIYKILPRVARQNIYEPGFRNKFHCLIRSSSFDVSKAPFLPYLLAQEGDDETLDMLFKRKDFRDIGSKDDDHHHGLCLLFHDAIRGVWEINRNEDKVQRALKVMDFLWGTGQFSQEDLNTKNEVGNTPLHVAYVYNLGSAIERLKSWGADQSIVNDAGLTPECMASYG